MPDTSRQPDHSPTDADCASGYHLLADLRITDTACLLDDARLHAAMAEALRAQGFTILHDHIQRFPGTDSGSTGIFVLAESHASWHSYPEADYLAIDIFSCGNKDPMPVLAHLQTSLPIEDHELHLCKRTPLAQGKR